MRMTLDDIAHAMGASLDERDSRLVTRVCIDSRAVQAGDLFFCIVGQNLDGHEFARQAIAQGAAAVVASKPLDVEAPVLLVRDTTQALGRLARAWREQSGARVVGVTGSAGKTTLKEMLAAVLGAVGTVGKNFRNFNNQIGLPLSILELSGDEDFWVLELGISRPGDMDELGYVLAPDFAVVINIGPCHLEGLGSLAGVAAEKAKLLDYVRPQGFACVNADYPLLLAEAQTRDLRQITFSGSARPADYSCLLRADSPAGYVFQVRSEQGDLSVRAPLNAHVTENMAAVVALTLEMGFAVADIEQGLGGYAPVVQRFVQNKVGSWVFIDDTYNANPVSMARSIQEADALARGKRLVLVLADMKDLGGDSDRAHRELGALIATTAATHCFFSGEYAASVQSGLGGYAGTFRAVASAEDVLQAMAGMRAEPGVMLFKGSRGCKMENYYSYLERNWA